jgi:hypothetical protein
MSQTIRRINPLQPPQAKRKTLLAVSSMLCCTTANGTSATNGEDTHGMEEKRK